MATISTIIPAPKGMINPVADGEMQNLWTTIDKIITNGWLARNAPTNKTITSMP
jgi:hypothetical protein